MKQKLSNLLAKLIRENRGVVAVEYALIIPAFFSLMLGSFEIGRILMVYSALEGAVTESSRIAMTGNVPDGYPPDYSVEEYIRDYVENSLENVGVDAGVNISMNVYESFSAIGAEEPYTDIEGNLVCDNGDPYTDVNDNGSWDADMGASGTGGQENIMLMRIGVELPYMMHGVIEAFSNDTHINLSTSTAIRNEPFGGLSWTPSNTVRNCV